MLIFLLSVANMVTIKKYNYSFYINLFTLRSLKLQVYRLSKTFVVIVANYMAKPDSMLGQIMVIPGCTTYSSPLIMLHKGMVMCAERLQSEAVF